MYWLKKAVGAVATVVCGTNSSISILSEGSTYCPDGGSPFLISVDRNQSCSSFAAAIAEQLQPTLNSDNGHLGNVCGLTGSIEAVRARLYYGSTALYWKNAPDTNNNPNLDSDSYEKWIATPKTQDNLNQQKFSELCNNGTVKISLRDHFVSGTSCS